MTISASQIKFMESEVLADTSDGGGRMSGRDVIDGEINNVFPDISRRDRVTGRTRFRKLFLAVRTLNQDTLLGPHAIILKQSADPLVRSVLFSTGSHTDRRADARNRLEAYVVKSSDAQWYLWGRQLAGQRAIQAVQRKELRAPEPGEVYCLTSASGTVEQYVKILGVDAEVRTFAYIVGGAVVEFERRALYIRLSAPLTSDFEGSDPTPTDQLAPTAARVKETQVADAARYYGTSPLALAGVPGDMAVTVDSVWDHLVPSAQSETAVTDREALAGAAPIVAGASAPVTVTVGALTADAEGWYNLYLSQGAVPGSISISVGDSTFLDAGGELQRTAGTMVIDASSVDYATGLIRVRAAAGAGWHSATKTCQFRPGAAVSATTESFATEVTLANRGINYLLTARPFPAPGTVVVEYQVFGKWYALRDNGNGELRGEGVGTVNYATGVIQVTLAALPDVGSSVLWYWGELQRYETRTGAVTVSSGAATYTVGEPVVPGSVSVEWDVGPTTYTATDNGAGALTGDAGGTVRYSDGRIIITTSNAMAPGGGDYRLSWNVVAPAEILSDSHPATGVAITHTLPGAPIEPRSVYITTVVAREYPTLPTVRRNEPENVVVYDNGSGALMLAGVAVGTINYSTGAVSFNPYRSYQRTVYNYENTAPVVGTPIGAFMYAKETATETAPPGGAVVDYRYAGAGADSTAGSATAPAAGLTLQLPYVPGTMYVPGSIRFTWRGKTYIDRAGVILRDISGVTNAGSAVGTVDYATAQVSITSYEAGDVSAAGVLVSGAVSFAELVTARAMFRTPGAPVRSQSLSIRAARADGGGEIVATAASDDTIVDDGIEGVLDSRTGVVRVEFKDALGDPVAVFASTIRISAISYTSLPLDPSIIGIDPVRLPSDGRVPIFREADVVVISHTAETAVPSPVAGGTVSLARHHQAELWVTDEDGAMLDPAQYTVDLEAGTLTWADPLVLQTAEADPLAPPLVIHDRVEDMSRLLDVQIGGRLALQSPLTHDYPAGESVVASALLFEDLRSRVWNLFHQASWTGVWSDERIGADTTAKYNAVAHPIEINNVGSIQERWVVRFNSTTTFEVIGETVGVIASGNTSTDCAPLNPAGDGAPYFIIRKEGWSSGWSAGNCVRFNTDGAQAPLWVVRTVLSGPKTVDDKITLQRRGDAD